jgi:phosphatidylglycerophosphate synthase
MDSPVGRPATLATDGPVPPVGGRPSYGETLRRLRSAQKPAGRGAPAYSRFVNRRLGRLLAAGCHTLGLTPNQVTLVSALCSAAALVLLVAVPSSTGVGIAAAVLLALGYAFDSADGQVARLRGGGSPAGEWLDHVVDSFKEPAVHLAVLVAWYRWFDLPDQRLLLVPVLFSLLATGAFFATWITDVMRRAHADGPPALAAAGAAGTLRSLAVIPTDYGVLILSFALLGLPAVFLTVYTALAAFTALFLLAALPKWFREVSAFGRPRPVPAGAAGAR